MGNISPQKTWDENSLLSQPLDYHDNKLSCVEPDYTLYVDAKQIRRMSRIIKMGVASSAMAMKEAGITKPDSIITATAYGCLDDTGTFLNKMIDNKEEALNPTPFIQSTHNTIGSQIALLLQCQGYNQTYTHGAFSFESALLDGMLQVSENPEKKILVGGIDEITSTSHQIQSRFGIFRENVGNSLNIFNTPAPGTLNGEGSAFFVLSGEKAGTNFASIEAVRTFYKPDQEELRDGIRDFIENASLRPEDVDLVLTGKSGDRENDSIIDQLAGALFPSSAVGVFKHLSGEYPVATAFACWLGARILKDQVIPQTVLSKGNASTLKNILVFNQYFGTHYTLILLRAC